MIIDNPYISGRDSSNFTVQFDNFFRDHSYCFINSTIKYPNWHKNIDVLKYVKDLEALKRDPKTYFIFDASNEGFSPFKTHFFDNLYYSCKIHSLDPQKIIFVSSNMLDKKNLRLYNKINRINHGIKSFCFLSFRSTVKLLLEDHFDGNLNPDTILDYYKNKTSLNFQDKYGLSLSRVNRNHRILANFLIYKNNLENKFLISQDKVTNEKSQTIQEMYQISSADIEQWRSALPKIIDTDNFQKNHALTLHTHLNTSSLFQIVNETHVNNWNNTSLFYSEKTFKTIANMQPFLIFGQPGCNHKLEDFGFKLFRDLFNYDFDYIIDTKKRYEALLETVKHAIALLDTMSREEQIAWKFAQEDVLKHNFCRLIDNNLDFKKFKKLELKL